MALFGFGKDKKDEGSPELVLAYLEDAQRTRVPFTLRDPKGRELSANLQSIDEGGGRVSFQPSGSLLAEKGDKVRIIFILEGLRLGAQGRVAEIRSGLVVMELPTSLELMERRKKARARLNPREGTTLTALTSLFEGVGISGVVESISEEGARVKVERALEVKGERRLNIGQGLFQPGHVFMVVRITKLPRSIATLELTGKVVYLDTSGSGLSVGIAFVDPPSDMVSALRNVVSAKGSGLPTSIPPKARRSRDTAPPSEPRANEPVEAPVEKPPAPSEPASAPDPVPVPPPPVEKPPEKNSALLRIKKRARVLLLAMTSGAPRDLLVTYLSEEGYGKVLVAGTLTELLGHLKESTVALIFIDGGVAELQGLDLAEALQEVGEAHIPLILAAEEVSTATVLAARRAGVDQLVVKPYALDDTLSDLLEQQLGIG